MSKFISCLLFVSMSCSGLWGCAAHKPNLPPAEVAIPTPSKEIQPLPPLPKPETSPEMSHSSPELYFDTFEPEIIARQILVGIETVELPETGVCLFWNPVRQGGQSRNVFLLEKSGQSAQMYPMLIVSEDIPKTRKTFAVRSILVPGKAGIAGWRMLCKPMELVLPKRQAI